MSLFHIRVDFDDIFFPKQPVKSSHLPVELALGVTQFSVPIGCRLVQLHPQVFRSAPVHYVAVNRRGSERLQSNLHLHLCLAMPGFMPLSSSDSLSKWLTSVAAVIEGLDYSWDSMWILLAGGRREQLQKRGAWGGLKHRNNGMVDI